MGTGITVDANADSLEPSATTGEHGGHGQSLLTLAVGAVGVVFGDIGTSPLYAFRETFASPHHPLPVDGAHILGVISLMFWSMMIVVSLKYVAIIMRADNKGEGGSLALLALVSGLAHFAEAVGATVVAEGIELEPQLRHLGDLGIALAQGYLLARPLVPSLERGAAPAPAALA